MTCDWLFVLVMKFLRKNSLTVFTLTWNTLNALCVILLYLLKQISNVLKATLKKLVLPIRHRSLPIQTPEMRSRDRLKANDNGFVSDKMLNNVMLFF